MTSGLQVFNENGTEALDVMNGLIRFGGVVSTKSASGSVQIDNPNESKVFVLVQWRTSLSIAQLEITIGINQISWKYPNQNLSKSWIEKNGADLYYGFYL